MLQSIFVSIYDFFSRRKKLCWAVFFISFAAWVGLSFKVHFQEDITSMLPNSKALHAMNDVISHTQAGEQVVFLMSFKDTTHTDPDSLINAATSLQMDMQAFCGRFIDTIKMQMGQEYEEALLKIFQNNLPLFLTEADYQQLDSLLLPQHIKNTLATNKRILMSPASVV